MGAVDFEEVVASLYRALGGSSESFNDFANVFFGERGGFFEAGVGDS